MLSSDAYVRAFGSVGIADDLRVQRAGNVFKRLLRVIDRVQGVAPRLYVVNSEAKPWAIAMPDGGIVLSRGVLDVCYRENDRQLGDARLAFVLGHELSHLTSNDFWHRDVNLSFADTESDGNVARIRETLARVAGVSNSADVQDFFIRMRERELVADDRGFLYAAVAGYPVDKLIAGHNGGFLTLWVEQTRSFGDETHFSASERTAFLQQRLGQLRDQSLMFKVGMQLGHFGYFDAAIGLTSAFYQKFPSKEVLNNLGYFHLRKALQSMPTAIAYDWWFPTVAEFRLPDVVSTRGLSGVPEVATQHLEIAADYLKRAGDADSRYLPSRVNLATTQYFLGQPHAARATIEEIKSISPDNIDARMIEAPVLIAQNPGIDVGVPALNILATLAAANGASAAVHYNHARMLDKLDKGAQANIQWQRLSTLAVPTVYQQRICQRLAESDCGAGNTALPAPPAIDPPVRFGTDVDSAPARALLQSWQHRHYRIENRSLDIFVDRSGQQLVAVDAKVVLYTAPASELDNASAMAKDYAAPLAQSVIAAGRVLRLAQNFSLLTEGPLVREVWLSAH